jgi:hypothetical protein
MDVNTIVIFVVVIRFGGNMIMLVKEILTTLSDEIKYHITNKDKKITKFHFHDDIFGGDIGNSKKMLIKILNMKEELVNKIQFKLNKEQNKIERIKLEKQLKELYDTFKEFSIYAHSCFSEYDLDFIDLFVKAGGKKLFFGA